MQHSYIFHAWNMHETHTLQVRSMHETWMKHVFHAWSMHDSGYWNKISRLVSCMELASYLRPKSLHVTGMIQETCMIHAWNHTSFCTNTENFMHKSICILSHEVAWKALIHETCMYQVLQRKAMSLTKSWPLCRHCIWHIILKLYEAVSEKMGAHSK